MSRISAALRILFLHYQVPGAEFKLVDLARKVIILPLLGNVDVGKTIRIMFKKDFKTPFRRIQFYSCGWQTSAIDA